MKTVLICLAVFGLISTIVPLFKSDVWWVRMFDFPFVQVTLIIAMALVGFLFYWNRHVVWDNLLLISLIVALGYKGIIIYPYTFLASHQMLHSSVENDENTLSLLSSNVLMDNRNSTKLTQEVAKKNPDVILLLEPDKWWLDEFSYLKEDYPYYVEVPLDNKYGMALYSRLELISPTVHYLLNPEIPSIHTKVELRSGKQIQLYNLHPMPPSPTESDTSTERDAELLVVGKKIEKESLPTIVAGDLNDVAWSSTTRLFQKISQLLDPRIGRGFFNTFHAKNILLRWPLDHVFCSDHFKLVKMERLPDIDSDHFPIYAKFHFDPIATLEQESPEADAKDKKRANKKIKEGFEE